MTRHHIRAKIMQTLILVSALSVLYPVWAVIVYTGHTATRERDL